MEKPYQSLQNGEIVAQVNMVSINTHSSVQKIERRDIFISISLALYIFSSYWIKMNTIPMFGSLVLYLFLGLTFFKLITNQTPLSITAYSLWYFAFGILGALSYYYALDYDSVLSDLYLLFVSLILTFSFIQYIQDYSSFLRIFSFYAYSPIILVLYFFANGTMSNPGQRLGDYEFGNANNLAIVMMITLCCIFWFIFYGRRKYLLINILLAIIFLYVTSLSGGRKYLLVPFIFMLLILIFKYWRTNKSKLVLYMVLFSLIIFVGVLAVTNIPVLYDHIGIRFEGLLNFAQGDLDNTDTSTVIRSMMIDNGWRWFLQQPVQGYGLNNYRVLLAEILGGGVYAHNNFIELMVDLGAVGLFVYYSLYVYLIAKLFGIRDDPTGIRNFFLAFLLALLIFEMGAVTYQLYVIQIFVSLASAFIFIHSKNHRRIVAEIPSTL